ncbi:family 89 glycoside hydrolase [Lojkania enalia]|uniref:Family 89 glycoside hydrolase n=1 Tax=Lojkania enalia TaxID=147567 RepID=A0A9P4N3F0_9PLEO|nr:family 89 glycoside hydrolase [Didymosphaeria enalia]
MRPALVLLAAAWALTASTISTQGLYDLVKRRLPSHAGNFVFTLTETNTSGAAERQNDEYAISCLNDAIAIEGNSLSALATGLRRYFTDVAHEDIYWFIGSRLDEAPSPLPRPNGMIKGKSVVPWRYYFNTVTFSYTAAFWSWSDWELELDWLALHGVNLPLAWVGFEKILLDVFLEANLTISEIMPFFSGPAFQAWNRFGNIQGSWGGELPMDWVNSQFELQKKILERMLELGMTPILPAFTGFVPRAIANVYPNASIVNGSRWEDFPSEYTNTTFLEPADPLFAHLQSRVVGKQIEYYGNITQFYTLDQYNENDPFSGGLSYLRNVTRGTWQSLKTANPAAVWVMQGWLFYSNSDFWSNERIEAYLSGIAEDSDMLILDLFSESQPQWQRTQSYYGKPWIWNQLHNYGGNMGLYGQIDNVTVNPIEALHESESLVGFGLTPEGQEGNEIIYTLLLDQAWSPVPINTTSYFRAWVRSRYGDKDCEVPEELYAAWEILRTTVYNNKNLTSNAVPKAIFELAPNITGLTNRTGHHPTTLHYPPSAVLRAWQSMYDAAKKDPELWSHPAYQHDIVDITRQVLSNEFLTRYEALLQTWTASSAANLTKLNTDDVLELLHTLNTLLATLPQFSLSPYLASARKLAPHNLPAVADFYVYDAVNQITWWGPNAEINDYASKSWAGLVGTYYFGRWEAFLGYLRTVTMGGYDDAVARQLVREAERKVLEVGLWGVGEERVREGVRGVLEQDVVPLVRELEG